MTFTIRQNIMYKKTFIILMTIPFFGFGQSKTEKVATQVGAAAVVTAGVIGLFKKNKKTDKTEDKTTFPTQEEKKSNVKAMDFYELLLKLIPDTGQTANINAIDRSSKFVKWGDLTQPIKGIYNFDGEGKIAYDNVLLCEDFCSYINFDVNASGNYNGFGIEIQNSDYKDDPRYSDSEYVNDEQKYNLNLLTNLLGKRNYVSKFLIKSDNSLGYEFEMPGKNKVWVTIMVALSYYGGSHGTGDEPYAILMNVYFNKTEFDNSFKPFVPYVESKKMTPKPAKKTTTAKKTTKKK